MTAAGGCVTWCLLAQAFASKTKRFIPAKAPPTALDTTDADITVMGTPDVSQVRGDPARLGPGSYTLPDQWAKSKVRRVLPQECW